MPPRTNSNSTHDVFFGGGATLKACQEHAKHITTSGCAAIRLAGLPWGLRESARLRRLLAARDCRPLTTRSNKAPSLGAVYDVAPDETVKFSRYTRKPYVYVVVHAVLPGGSAFKQKFRVGPVEKALNLLMGKRAVEQSMRSPEDTASCDTLRAALEAVWESEYREVFFSVPMDHGTRRHIFFDEDGVVHLEVGTNRFGWYQITDPFNHTTSHPVESVHSVFKAVLADKA